MAGDRNATEVLWVTCSLDKLQFERHNPQREGHIGSTSVMVVQTHAAPRSSAGPACAQRWCGHVSSGIPRNKCPLVVGSPSATLGSNLVALQALSGVLLLGDPIHKSPIKDLPKHLEIFHTHKILGNNLKKSCERCLTYFFTRSVG